LREAWGLKEGGRRRVEEGVVAGEREARILSIVGRCAEGGLDHTISRSLSLSLLPVRSISTVLLLGPTSFRAFVGGRLGLATGFSTNERGSFFGLEDRGVGSLGIEAAERVRRRTTSGATH
jgi:hypothetical protein